MPSTKHGTRWRGGPQPYLCEQCGETFLREPSKNKGKRKLFCSRQCHDVWQHENPIGAGTKNWGGGPAIVPCAYCGTKLLRDRGSINRTTNSFCGNQCQGPWKSENWTGPKCPAWRGGGANRPRYETRRWAKDVIKRAGKKCEACGKAKLLQAHHIFPYAENVSLRMEPDNGMCLCRPCHWKVHRKEIVVQRRLFA
jgi:hypothetical protein